MFIHFQNCAVHEVHPLKPAFQQLCARSVAAWMFQALEYIRAELEHFFGAHKSYVSAVWCENKCLRCTQTGETSSHHKNVHILPRWRCARRRHPLSQAVNRVLQTSSETPLLGCLPRWSFLYLNTAAACFSVQSVLARFALLELTVSRNLSFAISLDSLYALKIFVEIRESQSKQKSAKTQSPWRLRFCCGCRHARNQICNRYIVNVFESYIIQRFDNFYSTLANPNLTYSYCCLEEKNSIKAVHWSVVQIWTPILTQGKIRSAIRIRLQNSCSSHYFMNSQTRFVELVE